MAHLKCKNCNYRSVEIDHPYGLPSSLIYRAVEMHCMGSTKHHEVVVIQEGNKTCHK